MRRSEIFSSISGRSLSTPRRATGTRCAKLGGGGREACWPCRSSAASLWSLTLEGGREGHRVQRTALHIPRYYGHHVPPRRERRQAHCRVRLTCHWFSTESLSCLLDCYFVLFCGAPPQAIIVLCRGIFTPQNDVVETKWEHHVFAAVFQPESGGYPLADAFAEVRFGLCSSSAVLRLFSLCFSRRSLLLFGWAISRSSSTARRPRLNNLFPARLLVQHLAVDSDGGI